MGNAKILVFSESADTLAELLTAGRTLVSDGGEVIAVSVGTGAKTAAEDSLKRGADEVLVAQTSEAGAEMYVAILEQAVELVVPDTILIGATRMGSDVVARLAQALGVPCASSCMALRRNDDGSLEIERRVYGGRFNATQVIAGRPQLASVPPGRFAKAEEKADARGSTRELTVPSSAPRVRTTATEPRARSSVDVSKAEIIVSAGRGLKKVEDLALLEKLAGVLGGVLAGSRPLTGDVDWLPTDRRIGLSGKTVKPNLYIACGISGQIEHIVGMKGARTVVAINSDAKAPIHAEADYSLVADLYEIVPAFLEAIEDARRNRAERS